MSSDDDIEIEGPDLPEDDPMRAFLPAAFGKKPKETDIAAQLDRSRRQPAPAQNANSAALEGQPVQEPGRKKDDDSSDSSDDSSDDSDDGDEFPVSHELVLKT